MLNEWMNTDILGSRDQGRRLRAWLAEHLRRGEPLTLDFQRVEVMTSAFADECFGKLWDAFDHDQIRRLIRLIGLRGNNLAIFRFVLSHR
ncbi:MAG: STAS-like domain-containing protein [Sulfobacillus thermotolerans]|nr:STAS-like domain-containing protein [Sulfobacillus thermotolerans]